MLQQNCNASRISNLLCIPFHWAGEIIIHLTLDNTRFIRKFKTWVVTQRLRFRYYLDNEQKEELTMMVMELVFSSIIILPYCKSLWQNTICWWACESSFSNIEMSSSIVSKQKALASSGEAKLLAACSHFLHCEKQINKKIKNYCI